MGERRDVYRVLMGKPEGKSPLGRPRHRWEDNTTMVLQEVGCGGTDWIELAQDRVSVFYKTIFRPSLTIGRFIQCMHTLWDPIVFI